MFPAHAGMNRMAAFKRSLAWYVPRTRGDEPVDASQQKRL